VPTRIRDRIKDSPIPLSLQLLNKKDLKKVYGVAAIQIFMGFLDLAGVAVIGILGALSVSGIQSQTPTGRAQSALKSLSLDSFAFQEQVAILGGLAAALLLSRTIFSIIFTRKTLFFLSHKSSKATADLVSKLLSQSLLEIQKKPSQEILFSVTHGVSAIMVGVIGTSISIVADLSLLIILGAGLFFIDTVMAIGTVLLFGGLGFVLYLLLNKRARDLGNLNTRLSIQSNEKILEVINSYREAFIHNRRDYYAREIGAKRFQLGEVLAENAFLPYISKYVIESALVFGALGLCAIQFALQDASQAVATLAVFLAAGSRIAPAALRLQQGSISIKNSLAIASPTLDLLESLKDIEKCATSQDKPSFSHIGFEPRVTIDNLHFRYPGNSNSAIAGLTTNIEAGSLVALVGPSGAGKTSAADVPLGILNPDLGTVRISGQTPARAILEWPGAISYVPQDVVISNGSIKQNVCLGFNPDLVPDRHVWDALEAAQLNDFVKSLPKGMNSEVGERGTKISGGQRQRLGIARALFTNPRLLVLDEATSALDGETEAALTTAILRLKGKVTVIVIAHRLSTVRDADNVIYLDGGRVVSQGTFEEVRTNVPDFDRQAKLMGL